MDIEEPTFEITSFMPFVCGECKIHETMITNQNKENETLMKENAELKACVRYFYQIFIFSPNDSPSKNMKDFFYFI